ncbi:MAG: GIY-YIG nuclease family protein [Candidatus Omnitrophica bacterium]|nr:GIY-YIG nuclease family protein [Candidatus Omnitrophota bacterium]
MYVYIIKCSDDSYYVGVTNNLRGRYIEHELGQNSRAYTFFRRPFKLLYWEYWDSPGEAIAREKQLKRWSRAKKEALIYSDIDTLKRLSISCNKPAKSQK